MAEYFPRVKTFMDLPSLQGCSFHCLLIGKYFLEKPKTMMGLISALLNNPIEAKTMVR